MNLRDIEYFVAVAETGQFNAAAERCHVSQPTLSGQIRKLEAELDQALFERDTRNVRLTSFGREALNLAQMILRYSRALERKAKEMCDPFCGAVTLGAFPTLAPWLLPRLSPIFMEAYPKAEFFLTEDKTPVLQAQLASGEIDAAFLALPQELPDMEHVALFSEEFLVAVAAVHPWAGRDHIAGEELKGTELLLLADGHCLRDQALDLCRRYGAKEKGYFRATGLETLRQMVRMNTGITLIPRLAIPDHDDPGLSYIPVAEGGFRREICLSFRHTHPRRKFFQALAGLVRQQCGTVLPVQALCGS